MKIAYTGKLEKLDQVYHKKFDSRIAKLSKMLN